MWVSEQWSSGNFSFPNDKLKGYTGLVKQPNLNMLQNYYVKPSNNCAMILTYDPNSDVSQVPEYKAIFTPFLDYNISLYNIYVSLMTTDSSLSQQNRFTLYFL